MAKYKNFSYIMLMIHRRNFLAILAAVGTAATGVLVARPALAFRELPASDYSLHIKNSCGISAQHLEMLQQAEAALNVQLTAEQRQQALAALRCPQCGCALLTGT